MRLRPTAAALLGALALILPAAGTSLAIGHGDDDGWHDDLGRLDYRLENGDVRSIRPADNDTCYELTGASRSNPARAVRNRTESIAVLFRERGCDGRATRTLQPNDEVHDVSVRSVFFKPTHTDDDRWDDGRWDEDRWDGRDGLRRLNRAGMVSADVGRAHHEPRRFHGVLDAIS